MKNKFMRVADRSAAAATSALGAGVQEKAAFLSYHAFESSGAALGTHIGLNMGKGVTHPTKLNRFRQAASVVGIGKQVALLAVRLAPMRNRFLYPEELPDGTIKLPEEQITNAKTAQLLREVKHLVTLVKAQL